MFVPFSGWLFNTNRVAEPGLATSPPYDVISEEHRRSLLECSPYNIVRLLLPNEEPGAHLNAARILSSWRLGKIIMRDITPRFYLYETDYYHSDGTLHTVRGVFGALRVTPFGPSVIPHEETMAKHREDRLSLLRATQANLDPIIALSSSPQLSDLLQSTILTPRIEFEDPSGAIHRLFDISEIDRIAILQDAISSHPVSIADGHHRYTTALRYQEEQAARGPGPWDYILAMIAPAEGSGLTIAPYHRVLTSAINSVSSANDSFEIFPSQPVPPQYPGDIVLVSKGESWRLHPREHALVNLAEPYRLSSTAVATNLLYPLLGIDEDGALYTENAIDAIDAAESEKGTALLVAPLEERAISIAGKMGLRFPTKSTYFIPKPLAGLVIRCFDN